MHFLREQVVLLFSSYICEFQKKEVQINSLSSVIKFMLYKCQYMFERVFVQKILRKETTARL